MNSLHRVIGLITRATPNPISLRISHTRLNLPSILVNLMSTKSGNDEDKWNDAWESAWLPDDLTDKIRAPWETDVNFSVKESTATTEEIDVEAKAFVEDMNEHWNERRGKSGKVEKREEKKKKEIGDGEESSSLYSLETMKKDYRLKKQRVHASLWVKEIEKLEEAKLGDSGSVGGGADDIDRLLDSCSEIFDSVDHDFDKLEVSSGSELKNKPDGWESTAKEQDGNLWEMSQREEDILLQEFDRRTAFCKFQIASFIKQHIFSRSDWSKCKKRERKCFEAPGFIGCVDSALQRRNWEPHYFEAPVELEEFMTIISNRVTVFVKMIIK